MPGNHYFADAQICSSGHELARLVIEGPRYISPAIGIFTEEENIETACTYPLRSHPITAQARHRTVKQRRIRQWWLVRTARAHRNEIPPNPASNALPVELNTRNQATPHTEIPSRDATCIHCPSSEGDAH